jgi:hypothetical protein
MRKIILFLGLILACSYSYQGSSTSNTFNIEKASLFENYVNSFFDSLETEELDRQIFIKSLKGYYKLKGENKLEKSNILTVVDFTKSSNFPRMFIIDMNAKKIIHKSLVSHGRGSGDEFATSFSNIPNSFQSSLGFYITGEVYTGAHGTSLRLDGVEKGFNDKARVRGIVIHSADYVNEAFAKKVGRLGRSHGCPALPEQGYAEIIDIIKDKTAFFIFYPENNYLTGSEYLNDAAYLAYFDETSFI